MNPVDELRRILATNPPELTHGPRWRELVSGALEQYRWRPATGERIERPEVAGTYAVIKRRIDGASGISQAYWTGHSWDGRAQVLYWRARDLPES